MKIAVAQIRPEVGAVEKNVDRHLKLIDLGVSCGADLIVFPELSLTGYEPSCADAHARYCDDFCFDRIQSFCNQCNLTTGVGFSLRTDALPRISNLLFGAHVPPSLYSKRFLHQDEVPFFECGEQCDSSIFVDPVVALAICYELSVPEHADAAFASGASAYVASAAKTARGVGEASRRLSGIARRHSAIVMLANCLGPMDGVECAGRSAVWGRNGQLLARLDESAEGVIVVDYDTEQVVVETLAYEID
ncbi:MAG: carbon-nitrogen hydrolase family protein [Fuerstiella sp.]